MTYKFIKPSLDDLNYDQLQRALNDLEMIGEYTKNVHFVHDLQLLCQDSAPDEEENGRIFVIDPGELRKPKKNQMRVRTSVHISHSQYQNIRTSTPEHRYFNEKLLR